MILNFPVKRCRGLQQWIQAETGGDTFSILTEEPYSNDYDTCLNRAINLKAVDVTGASVDELYRLIDQDIPVVVWCTIGMEERRFAQGWYTETGEYVDWEQMITELF